MQLPRLEGRNTFDLSDDQLARFGLTILGSIYAEAPEVNLHNSAFSSLVKTNRLCYRTSGHFSGKPHNIGDDMRIDALPTALTLLVITLFTLPALAGSASGGFHAGSAAGAMNIEFEARATDASGGGTGSITFQSPIVLSEDEDNPFGSTGPTDLRAKVEIDCLRVSGNRAAMSGTIRDANVVGYTGRRVLLTVEDGGEGANAAPDKFTWGVYNVETVTWFPTDAELKFDDGAKLQWRATDAERDDDVGIEVNGRHQNETTCRSFDLAAYDLVSLPRGSGNIQVRP